MRHEQERTDGRTIELEREKSVRVTVWDLEEESNEKSLRERGPFLFVCGVRKKYFYHYFFHSSFHFVIQAIKYFYRPFSIF